MPMARPLGQTNWVTYTSSTNSATNTITTGAGGITGSTVVWPTRFAKALIRNPIPKEIPSYWTGSIALPDGAILIFDNGKYRIEDKDAKITYKANYNREYNKFVGGSDLLEEFIQYLGSLNLSQKEAMNISVEMFITWLIIKAAEKDQEDVPVQEVLMLETNVKQKKQHPHCKCCGRFIRLAYKKSGIEFCNGSHMDKWTLTFNK